MAPLQPNVARRCAAEFIGTFGLLFARAGAIIGAATASLTYVFLREHNTMPGGDGP